jgi:soluble lytic murein transglycosylase-like protein
MLLRTVIFLALLGTLLTVRAGADPVAAFLQARQNVAAALLSPAQAADAVQHPGSYAGRSFDVAVAVSGRVEVDGQQTALLVLGEQTFSVTIPASLRGADWLDSGARLRVLLTAAPDDAALPSGLRLAAAAPEGDIVGMEKTQAARQSALMARQASLASRALPMRRDGRRSAEPMAYAVVGHPAGALSARALAIYGPYRGLVRRWNRRLSETDVDKITTSILYFSDLNNIDPRLVVATIIAESDFDIHSTSRAGAMGLAQIMPDEAHGLGVTDAYDPIQNIGAAVHLLRGHLDKYGGAPANGGVIPFNQIALTMAAYNAGPGAVRKYHGVPPYRETRRYIARITALYRQMCGLTAG